MSRLRAAVILFFAAATTQAQPLDVPPSAAELRGWVDRGCVSDGRRTGIDYRGAVERAIHLEAVGLAELFRYTVVGNNDGAAGEAHCAVLLGLLQRWGDRRFAQVLRAQKIEVRKAVIDAIPIAAKDRRKFPLTYASAPSR